MKMDAIDKEILLAIQENANLPLAQISKRVGISVTPCWNRIKKMEENKIILGRCTLLNRKEVNLPIIVFLSISVSSHSHDWTIKFSQVVNKHNEIIEVHRLTGSDADYVLKVVARTVEDYDAFQQRLIGELEFVKMSSSISLQEIKQTYALPLDQV